jgi:hypothetical protein
MCWTSGLRKTSNHACEDGHSRCGFADDAILAFCNEADARKVLEVLPKRFACFGLTLHPTKTRLVRFRPHREQRAEIFDFLGFTLHWAKSRRGRLIIKHKTAKDRLRRGLSTLSVAHRRRCRVGRTPSHWICGGQGRAIARSTRPPSPSPSPSLELMFRPFGAILEILMFTFL